MKKRIFAFLLILILGFSLAGCSNKDTEKAEEKDKEELKDTDIVFSYDDPSEYITIPEDYIGIEVSEGEKVTDMEVNQQIEYAKLAHMKTKPIKEGIVKDGDTVHVLSKGTLKGEKEPFETAEYDVTIGSGEMISGYEEGLIGAKVSDTVHLHLTFPDSYGAEQLQGKEADFEVTIEYLCGEGYLADWTDEFVQEITNGDIKNTKDYENALRKELQAEKDQEAYYTQQSEIISYLVENSVVHKFPEGLVEAQYDSYLESYKQDNDENYGYATLDKYVLEEKGYPSMEEFYSYLQECAEKAATEILTYQAIAYKENLTLSKGEYDNYLQTFASAEGYTTAKKFEEDFMSIYAEKDKDFLYKRFLNQKVFDFLYENAKTASGEPVGNRK